MNVDRISFYGPIDSWSGYGWQALGTILALERKGVDVRVCRAKVGVDIKDTPPELERVLAKPFDMFQSPWSVIHTVPCALDKAWDRFPFWDHDKRKLAVRTMWEWDHLPGRHPQPNIHMPFFDWAELLNEFADCVLVPGSEQKGIFLRSGVTKPIHIVHDGVDTGAFPYTKPPAVNGEFRWFTWSFANSRKCPVETVESFQEAFPPNRYPHVKLTIKTLGHQFGFGHWGIPRAWLDRDPRITVVNERWTRERLLEEIARSHAVVWLSAGEGSGNPPMQALSVGRPVVCSNHSGLSEFANSGYFFPVRCSGMEEYPPKELTDGEPYYRWLNDIDDCARWMDHVYKNYELACLKANVGSTWVRRFWRFDDTADQLLHALSHYLEDQ